MFAKLNKLSNWQAAIIIAIVGFAVFFTGLSSAFRGDDDLQIVSNPVVHSITHIILFFEGGTFYNGRGLVPLSGTYFRPLMTTVFSLIYTMFGPHPFYYHMFQLLLCLGSTIVLYLFFRYSFKPALALFLSLVFLIHPIDSQVVYAIPSMQDALFFFFGILGLWTLIRFKSLRSLLGVSACLFLSLLAKETGILFIVMALLILFWRDRKRFYPFTGIIFLPIVFFLALRIHAVGFVGHPAIAPIDNLSLSERLFTSPSILLFYISKFIFPLRLASAYYWVRPSFSYRYFLLPLVIDIATVGLFVYFAFLLRKKVSKSVYSTYLFFAIWSALGLMLTLQIIPLDMTACETWFYFSMAGVLGMIGIILKVFPLRINTSWVLIIAVVVIGIFGFRTSVRSFDWRSEYTLARRDIVTSPEDFNAYNVVAENQIKYGQYDNAIGYLMRSRDIYTSYNSYNDLGIAYGYLGEYSKAEKAFNQGLKYSKNINVIYDNLAQLSLVYRPPGSSKQSILNAFWSALNKFPDDSSLWTNLAIFEDMYNDNADAKIAIMKASSYGAVSTGLYEAILNNQPFEYSFVNLDKTITIQ